MATIIDRERADSPDARALIAELERELDPLYPKTSRHGYSVDQLLRNGVAFFVTRHDGTPAGCGGVQVYGTEYAEIKRMYVRPGFRGLGLGTRMLEHLVEHGREHGVTLMRLETGIYQLEALALYERFGFRRIEPFGAYCPDALSVFYQMRIGD